MNVDFDINDANNDNQVFEDLAKERELSEVEKHIKSYINHLHSLTTKIDGSMNISDPDFNAFNIEINPIEKISYSNLIYTENQSLRKVILAVSVLCEEVDRLYSDVNDHFFIPLLLFEIKEFKSSSPEIRGAHILNLLHDLRCFIIHVENVCVNIYCQLKGLYSDSKSRKKYDATNVHFQVLFEKLGILLTIPITLTEILKSSYTLKMSLEMVDRMIKVDQSDEKRQLIRRLNLELTTFFFKQSIFEKILQSLCQIEGSRIPQVEKHMEMTIMNILSTNQENNNGINYVCASVLFILHSRISFGIDKRLLAELISANEKFMVVELVGNVTWTLGTFLEMYCPKYSQFVDKKLISKMKGKEWTPQLDKFIYSLHNKVIIWSCKFKFIPNSSIDINLMLQIIKYLFTIRNTLVVGLKDNLPLLGRLVYLLKFVQHFFFTHKLFFIRYILQSIELLNDKLIKLITDIKNIISKVTKSTISDDRIDILSCIHLIISTLNGPVTCKRIIVIKLAISGCKKFNIKGIDFQPFESTLNTLETFNNMFSICRKLCDCGFLLWYVPHFVDLFFRENSSLYSNQYTLSAFRDIVRITSLYPSVDDFSFKLLCSKLFSIVEKNSLTLLCSMVEQELRFASYLSLRLDDSFKKSTDWRDILRDQQMVFPDGAISLKEHVSHYLDSTFYNFTTIALYDSPIYLRMRTIGSYKYDFDLIGGQLPRHAINQGIDVLHLIREIGEFVSNYCYNINNQIFVQKNSPNKHLITIGIDQMSNSIRTHGNGIINTTVNFIYQFIREKLFLFSQFLFDSHIKSRLYKEIKYCDENTKYPFNRAERFNSEIRQLGIENGQTYLDRFRFLISHIGNALALVRLIRSAAMHISGFAVKFVPDLNNKSSFYDIIRGFDEHVDDAAKNFDSVLSSLIEGSSRHNEYFKILCDVFTIEFKSTKHSHLDDFYMILPSLTLNYIEYIICCKEKINRKEIDDAIFSDDGFAIGLVFILTVLHQYKKFDSLHWFTSVSDYYTQIIQSETASRATRNETNLQKAMSLTLKRLDTFKKEYSLLNFSMSSARIFFTID